MIIDRDFQRFWKVHEMARPNINVSQSLKELIFEMLAYQPYERPSLADLTVHEWFRMPVPSQAKVAAVMRERKMANKRAQTSTLPSP